MKNYRPYRLTKTGIRIPTRKVKWMASPKGSKSKAQDKCLDIAAPAEKDFKRLFTNNLNALIQGNSSFDSDGIITDEDWKESNQDED